MKNLFKIGVVLIVLVSCSTSNKYKLLSPNKNLELEFTLNEKGEACYALKANTQQIVDVSKLGLRMVNDENLDVNFSIFDISETRLNEKWETVWGTDKTIENNYNQILVKLKNENGLFCNLNFRLFNDGLGMRYEIPNQIRIDSIFIQEELTEFNFSQNATAWSIPANFDSYEFLYKTSSLDEVKNANTPLTFKTDLGWHVSVHEANLTNYAEMTLKNTGGNYFISELVPWPDGVKVKTQAPMLSPWRTITITNDAIKLIESNLVLNLNEPSKIKDVSWIKPLKYIGIWWGMHLGTETWTLGSKHGATTEQMKRYIDFASENNIDAVLAEGWNTGWENWGKPNAFDQTTPYRDFDFNEIVSYANTKQVKLIGHHETGGDIISYEARMDTAFKMLQDNKIHILKTGYAGPIPNKQYHHGQYMVNHYRKVVEKAAKYQLCIDAHEPIKPTGIRRTFPNMMTREGVRGMEWNAWSEGNPPEHHVIIPFTRGLAGPIDYTPGTFDILYANRDNYIKWNGNDKGNSRVNTTLAKQLALWITLYSPMQMASDKIENYNGHSAFNFFRNLPSEWDESKVVAAEIGDFLVIARRNDENWYIGATSDENARILELNLSFLDTASKYKALIYADGTDADWKTNPTSYEIIEKEVDSNTMLKVKMAAGGGQAIELIKL